MKVGDLIVEVRDVNLTRLGQVPSNLLRLTATPLHNAVGGWELTLPADHELALALRSPGAGILVTSAITDDVILSGPVTEPELAVALDDIAGSVKFTGITDDYILFDRLAYPQPGNADTRTQDQDYDTRTGPEESLLHAFVNANLGPSAPAGRRFQRLVMGADGGRGNVITKSARFDVIGELVAGIASTGDLRQRIVQRGNSLVFETAPVMDRSLDIRLDVRHNTLAGYRLKTSPPGVTHAIVGAQRSGEIGTEDPDVPLDRVFATISTPVSEQAGTAWGRRIERFVNQAYVDDEAEWTQSAYELLAEEGKASINVQAIPVDDDDFVYGRDWQMGDYLTIVAEKLEYRSQVTGIIISATADGVKLGAVLGDATAFNDGLSQSRALNLVESRLSAIERNGVGTVTGSAGGGTRIATFSFASALREWPLPHGFGTTAVTVTTFDSSGAELIGDLDRSDPNTTYVSWYFPTTGSAVVTSS